MLDLLTRDRHSEEYCAMYDICGERSDGKVLNCPYGSPSVRVCIIYLSLTFLPFISAA